MLFYSAKTQFHYLLQKKATIITFCIVAAFMLVNFWGNVLTNVKTEYITQMYDMTKTLTLSAYSKSGYFFMEFLPLLLVIPTCCAYLNDKNSQIGIYMQTRIGRRDYIYGKAIAVFAVTFLIFTLPFLIEILMSAFSFDLRSIGDPAWNRYEEVMEQAGNMLWGQVYLKNKFLYDILWILVFGVICGVLALFNLSVSMFRFVKYKVYTFFPLYILVCLIGVIERIWQPDFTLQYSFVFEMFQQMKFNYPLYLGFFIVIFAVAIVIMEKKIRQEDGVLYER